MQMREKLTRPWNCVDGDGDGDEELASGRVSLFAVGYRTVGFAAAAAEPTVVAVVPTRRGRRSIAFEDPNRQRQIHSLAAESPSGARALNCVPVRRPVRPSARSCLFVCLFVFWEAQANQQSIALALDWPTSVGMSERRVEQLTTGACASAATKAIMLMPFQQATSAQQLETVNELEG